MHEGVEGLLHDKTRPPGIAPLATDRVAEIVRLTQTPPPHQATHWTLRAMAKVAGVAPSTVQAIWKAHGLSPHRWRQFKLSNDPAFVEKLTDIVGLYVSPPTHAVDTLCRWSHRFSSPRCVQGWRSPRQSGAKPYPGRPGTHRRVSSARSS